MVGPAAPFPGVSGARFCIWTGQYCFLVSTYRSQGDGTSPVKRHHDVPSVCPRGNGDGVRARDFVLVNIS